MKIIYILIIFLIVNSVYSEIKFEQNDIKKSFVLSDSKTSQICETDKKILNYKEKINTIVPYNTAPYISVDDYSFAPYALSVNGNNPTAQSTLLRIKNGCGGEDGAQPLIIIGFTKPNHNEYSHNLPDIDKQNPLILNPGQEFTFRINFSPNNIGLFSDSIVFITEENLKCDNVCLLDAKSLDVGLYSQEYDWGKVRINYSKQPNNIYEPVGSELISVINTVSSEFGVPLKINNIYFKGIKGPPLTINGFYAFSFDSSFKSVLPFVPNQYFSALTIGPGDQSPQRKIYFRPTIVGEYEINYYFESNAEVAGKESRYVIKGHGIVPNLYLYQNDNAIEITDVVDFGTIENNVPQESVTERLIIANYPTNMDDGDVLTINSIDWGARATTNISNLGEMNNEFYVNESKMFEDLGQSGYPITLGIGESVDVEVTYFTKNNDTEHRSNVTIESDADESGQSGKFNNTITLLGNAKSSSVINKQTTSNFFPNPANNTITFDKSIKGNIEFYNLLGEKVLILDVNLKSTFDISQLQNGIYIIKYKINGQFYSEKLSVSK